MITDECMSSNITYMLKPVECKNCKHYEEDKKYKGEGKCNNDGRYTREHRVCNLLDTVEKRKNSKIRR